MPKSYRLSALAAALVLAAAPVAGLEPQASAAELSESQQALTQRATDYLQTLRTVTGRFTQTDSNGATSSGTLYLQRPGRARFSYDPPSGLLVVSDGSFVGVSDSRLRTFNEYPLGSTPLMLLLAREVRLDRGVALTGVEETPNGFSLALRDGRGKTQGRLTLLFHSDPVALRGWSLVDASGRTTQVRLGPLSPSDHFAPGLFYIRDPRH